MNFFKIIFAIFISSGFLFASSTYQNVPVLYSKAIYSTVKNKIPYEHCYNKKVYENTNSSSSNNIGLDTLIGGVLGVAAGNQIGGGSGKDAAKVIGGIGGALLANKLRDRKNYNNNSTYSNKEVCETRYHYQDVKKIIGYNNYFDLNGVTKIKRSSQKLDKVKVKISYSW